MVNNMEQTLEQLQTVVVGLEALKAQLESIIATLVPPTSDETDNTSTEETVATDTTTGEQVVPLEATNPEGTSPVN